MPAKKGRKTRKSNNKGRTYTLRSKASQEKQNEAEFERNCSDAKSVGLEQIQENPVSPNLTQANKATPGKKRKENNHKVVFSDESKRRKLDFANEPRVRTVHTVEDDCADFTIEVTNDEFLE